MEERNEVVSSLDEHLDTINSLSVSEKNYITAGSDGKINVFDSSNNSFVKILLRSQVPIRDVDIDANGSRVVVATDETIIRIVLLHDVTHIVTLEEHKYPAKCVKYDPKNEYLLSSASDGTVLVWDIAKNTSSPKVIKSFTRQFSSQSLPDTLQHHILAWQPNDGKYFAMPGKNGSLYIVQRKKWTFAMTLKDTSDDKYNNEINTIAWSSNGKYIATSCLNSPKIIIWDVSAKKLLTYKVMDDNITCFAWDPNRNEITYTMTDRDGIFYWKEPIPLSMQDPNSKTTTSSLPPGFSSSLIDEISSEKEDIEEDDDEEDGIVEIDDQGINLDDDLFSEMDSVAENKPEGQQIERRERPIYRNDLITSLEWPTTFQPGSTTFQKMIDDKTPEENERRYLDYNLVGVVFTIYRTTNSIINVEFHDQSNNRNFHFSDYNHYSMAALGASGLVLAVEGQERLVDKKKKRRRENNEQQTLDDLLTEDNGSGDDDDDDDILDDDSEDEDGNKKKKLQYVASILHFRPLTTWSNQKEWTIHLPDGENVEAVAINDVSVIAVTSKGYVRIYTLSGIQQHIFSVHDVVSIVARSDLAFLVCTTGPIINKSQQHHLEFLLINTSDRDILQRGPLPISSESELLWIGFSETSQLATFDSKQILRVLHRQRRPGQAAWVPIFDGIQTAKRREKTETYWPIGLLHDRLMCVILRGQLKEPYFPIPLPTEIELRMPTAAADPKYDDLEESYLRKRITTLHEKDEADATNTSDEFERELREADVEMDRSILRLIQLACKFDRFERALDLAKALHGSSSVDAAVQIASHLKLTTLAEKFISIKEQHFLNEGRQYHQHTKTLNEFRDNQVDLFSSSVSTMSSDLAFVDRHPSNNHYKRKNTSDHHTNATAITADSTTSLSIDLNDITFDDDFNVDDDDDDMLLASPLPKRPR
ncbi:unnamed protein product [Cunninghamella blakesleeana]